MSRRRPSKSDWGTGKWVVQVVCTGRGTHREVDFGSMAVLPSGSVNENLKVEEFFGGLDLENARVLATVPFVCRRCTPARNVPLRRENLHEICRKLAEHGESRLDLSALALGMR